jgi:hypothetical protein
MDAAAFRRRFVDVPSSCDCLFCSEKRQFIQAILEVGFLEGTWERQTRIMLNVFQRLYETFDGDNRGYSFRVRMRYAWFATLMDILVTAVAVPVAEHRMFARSVIDKWQEINCTRASDVVVVEDREDVCCRDAFRRIDPIVQQWALLVIDECF